MNTPIINRYVLREGMGISRRSNATVSKEILLATGVLTQPKWKIATMGYNRYIDTIKGWSHDAIIVRDPKDGVLKIGDALMSEGCVLTPIETWEQGCRDGDRIILWVPQGWTELCGMGAAAWWLGHVLGHKYDKVAIWRLATKSLLGDRISGKVGLYSDFYCTEGVRDAWAKGAGINPWGPNENPTPGTTYRRFVDHRLLEVLDSLTEEGRKYRIPI